MTKEHITGLPAWRLKRAVAFIELNLNGTITLPELAHAVGLSRMHFARRFRRSTGVRPHEYVLRRRVGRAKELLLRSDDSIASIAQASGFRTHAHFANVFHRFVGQAPSCWRHQMRDVSRDIRTGARLEHALTCMTSTLPFERSAREYSRTLG